MKQLSPLYLHNLSRTGSQSCAGGLCPPRPYGDGGRRWNARSTLHRSFARLCDSLGAPLALRGLPPGGAPDQLRQCRPSLRRPEQHWKRTAALAGTAVECFG